MIPPERRARCYLRKTLEKQLGLLLCQDGTFSKEPRLVFQSTMGRAKLWGLVRREGDDFLMELLRDDPDPPSPPNTPAVP